MLRDTARTSEVGRHKIPVTPAELGAVGDRGAGGPWPTSTAAVQPRRCHRRRAQGPIPRGAPCSGGRWQTSSRRCAPNDRVCPYGVSRIAIAFGPDAQAVARGCSANGWPVPSARAWRRPAVRADRHRPGATATRPVVQAGPPPLPRPHRSVVPFPQRDHPLHHPDHRGPIGRDRTAGRRPLPVVAPGPGGLDRLGTTVAPPHRHPLLHPPGARIREPPGRPPPAPGPPPAVGAVLVVDPDPAVGGVPRPRRSGHVRLGRTPRVQGSGRLPHRRRSTWSPPSTGWPSIWSC